MQQHKARQILQSLVQGIDPFNGEELAAGTALQRAEARRATLAALLEEALCAPRVVPSFRPT